MPTDGPGRTLLGVLIGTVTALADLASLDLASGRSTVTDGVLTVTGKTTLTNSDAFAGFYGAATSSTTSRCPWVRPAQPCLTRPRPQVRRRPDPRRRTWCRR